MFSVIAVIVGAIAAWVLVDHLLAWRNEQLHRGPMSWVDFGPGRTFHSAGFEQTRPPAEITDYREPDFAPSRRAPQRRQMRSAS
jgi:hypothetical protein